MSSDKVIYEALLYAAAELPAEVSELSLELAKRRPLRADVVARVEAAHARRREEYRKAEVERPRAPVPRSISMFGDLREPWPDGPHDRVDQDFEQAIMDGTGFATLAKAAPAAATEVLLAACIDPPKHEEFSPSSMPDASLAYWNSGYPPMYFRGPFLTFFRQAPDHALTFLIRLTNFATARYMGGDGGGITVTVAGTPRLWRGNANVFRWSDDGVSLDTVILNCALMAFEKYAYERLDAGDDISPLLQRIMAESESLAFAGLLLTIGKKSVPLLTGVLAPLLEISLLWEWDFQLTNQRQGGFSVGAFLGRESATFQKTSREWHDMIHRKNSIVAIVMMLLMPQPEHRALFARLRKRWRADEKAEPDESLRLLIARIDPANYTFAEKDGVPVTADFAWPATIQQANDRTLKQTNERLQIMQLPMLCRQRIDKNQPLSAAELPVLFDAMQKAFRNRKAFSGEDAPRRAEDGVLGGIALLFTFHQDWLKADKTRMAWCRARLTDVSRDPPQRRPYDVDTAVGNDNWDAFAAEVGVILLAADANDPLARTLVADGVLAFHYETTALLIRRAAVHRTALGADFERIIHLAVQWAALRPRLWHLAPPLTSEAKVWNKTFATLKQQFIKGRLPATVPTDLLAMNAEVGAHLDTLRRKQFESSPFYKPRRRGKAKAVDAAEDKAPPPAVVRLSLDARALKAAFSWVSLEGATSVTRPQILGLVTVLMSLVLKRLPAALDAKGPEIEELPTETDSWIYSVVAGAIPMMSAAENPVLLWRDLVALGAPGHKWVERFFWSWFTNGAATSADPRWFLAAWRAMVEFALGHPNWQPGTVRRHYLARLVVELLGFNRSWYVMENPVIAPHIASLTDMYRKAAATWFVLPDVLAGFARFAKHPQASTLALEGIAWVEAAAKNYGSYDWQHDVDEAVVEFLAACWKQDAAKIKANAATLASFSALLAILVARGGHSAIALRDRVANS